jgi:trimethylamine--corrinoid protein Co-methyltransferase
MLDTGPQRLFFERGDMVGSDRAQRVHETALRILDQVGLEILRQDVRDQMAGAGFAVRGDRVYLRPRTVEDYLERRRSRLEQTPKPEFQANDRRLWLSTNPYPLHVHDLETDAIVPYTTDKLVEMTKFVDTFADEAVWSAAPGYPMDVPPKLQPVIQYRVGAEYSRYGCAPVDPMTVFGAKYVFEMAEVLDRPIRSLPVYVFSPLRLGGESLDVALTYIDRLDSIRVGSMPSAGATAPVDPFGALSLAVAEVLGGAVTLSVVSGKAVDFGVGLHAFDLHDGSMIFGSPEEYLFGLAASDMRAFYNPGRPVRRAGSGILTRANWPDAQAAAEKASLMTAGALMGARRFSGVGGLSLDEVFSAEQFLVDCEIREHVQRLIDGLQFGDQAYDWVEQIREGVQGNFMTVDSTLDRYRQVYWFPRLFDRGARGRLGDQPRLAMHRQAQAALQQRLAQHDYELDPHRRAELQRIWRRAVEDCGEGTAVP